ncbi:MAG: diaminopimelate epimerase [Bacteroidota bacterium]
MKIKFYKYQGTGNDFIMVDDRNKTFDATNQKLIESLCDRRFGVGADGMILLQNHAGADFYMQYFNSDGRESSMCGNGGRCIAQFAKDLKIVADLATFYAVDGEHTVSFKNNWVNLQMMDVAEVQERTNNVFVLNTGSPHYVQFFDVDVDSIDLVTEAKKIRYNEEFADKGINVNFVSVHNNILKVRTYERGVEDETFSCGTGVTAAAIAFHKQSGNNEPTIQIETKGGNLSVNYLFSNNVFTNVHLNGPATFVYDGEIMIP